MPECILSSVSLSCSCAPSHSQRHGHDSTRNEGDFVLFYGNPSLRFNHVLFSCKHWPPHTPCLTSFCFGVRAILSLLVVGGVIMLGELSGERRGGIFGVEWLEERSMDRQASLVSTVGHTRVGRDGDSRPRCRWGKRRPEGAGSTEGKHNYHFICSSGLRLLICTRVTYRCH